MIIVTSSFSKGTDFEVFICPHQNEKLAVSNFSGRFRDGLVRTVGLTVEKKVRLQISPASCGRGFKLTTQGFSAKL